MAVCVGLTSATRRSAALLTAIAIGLGGSRVLAADEPGGASAAGGSAPPPAAARTPAARAILLPMHVVLGGAGLSAKLSETDAAQAARDNLTAALRAQLPIQPRLDVAPLPELTPAEQAALDEHLALLRLILKETGMRANYPPGPATAVDRSVGEGLAFLGEHAQADYAVYVDAAQVQAQRLPSGMYGGAVPYLIESSASNTIVSIALLDLKSGVVRCAKTDYTANLFGIKRRDLLSIEKATALVSQLLASCSPLTGA